jgi:hypothetical protein
MMTKAERRYVLRLEIALDEYQARHKKDMDVYREQSIEIIDLRARMTNISELLQEMLDCAMEGGK